VSGPVNIHVEELNAALIRLRLEPTDVLIVKVPYDTPEVLSRITEIVQSVVEDAGLPNRALAVPESWSLEAVSQAELVGT
jgi:hypothetical protein